MRPYLGFCTTSVSSVTRTILSGCCSPRAQLAVSCIDSLDHLLPTAVQVVPCAAGGSRHEGLAVSTSEAVHGQLHI